MKKVIALFVAAVLTLSLAAGCNSYTGGDKESEGSGDELFTCLAGGPVTLNPILSQSSNDGDVFYLIYTALMRMYQDEVLYDAAESYEHNDDFTEYTFHLRDCTFADGTPITAQMFEYTVYCMLTPSFGCGNADVYYMLSGAEAYNMSEEDGDWSTVGCKATDDKTLVFTLAYPDTDFVTELAANFLIPLQQSFVEEKGDSLGSSVENTQCSGPYILTDWQLESSLTFEKNDKYWDAENSFPVKKIEMVEVDDANTKVAMFENGEADAMFVVPASYIDHLGDEVTTSPANGINMMWRNSQGTNGALMSNANFGLALSYALDRESMMNSINPTTAPAVRVVSSMFQNDAGVNFHEAYPVDYVGVGGDVEKAKEYLAAALADLNYASVDELPTLRFVTYENSEQKLIAEAIIDQWKQNLGISVTLEQYTIGTAIGMFYTGDFDIFDIGIDVGVTCLSTMDSFTSGGSYDNGCWHSDEFDALIKQAKSTLDQSERFALASQAEQLMLSEAGIIPVFFQGNAIAAHDYVENFVVSTIGAGWQFNKLHVNK